MAIVPVEMLRVQGVLDPTAVDVEVLIDHLDRVSGYSDTSLDHVDRGSLRRSEDHDVTSLHIANWKDRFFDRRRRGAEYEPVYEEVVAD